MIGVLAELERSLISERTRAGVKTAQRRGVKFGRKVTLTAEQIDHARELIEKGANPAVRGPLDALPGACPVTAAHEDCAYPMHYEG